MIKETMNNETDFSTNLNTPSLVEINELGCPGANAEDTNVDWKGPEQIQSNDNHGYERVPSEQATEGENSPEGNKNGATASVHTEPGNDRLPVTPLSEEVCMLT